MKSNSLAKTALAFPLLLGLLSCSTAPRPDLYGFAVDPATPALPTIVITPNTQHVNVTGGDSIRFRVGDQAFAWNFSVAATVWKFDLRDIAPAGILDHPVLAYVAPDPKYIGANGGGHGHMGGGGGGHGGR